MSTTGTHALSGFRRWCVLAAVFGAIAAWFWFRDGDVNMVAIQLSWALLLLPGFIWDSRQSRPVRYFYNAAIAITLAAALYTWARVLGWVR